MVTDTNDVLLARLTTHPPRDKSDIAIAQWREMGLPKASTVRLTKLATVDRRLIHHRIGRLSPDDSHAVGQAWQQLAANVAAELNS